MKKGKVIKAIADVKEISLKKAGDLYHDMNDFQRENYVAIHNVRGNKGKKKISTVSCTVSTYSAPRPLRQRSWKEVGALDIVYVQGGKFKTVCGEEIWWLDADKDRAKSFLKLRSEADKVRLPYYIKKQLEQVGD
jgi:hypothetical protein